MRKPIKEVNKTVIIQESSKCEHDFIKENKDNTANLTSYICRKCGLGYLIDEKTDSIKNYQ